jgi:hypothetical protein
MNAAVIPESIAQLQLSTPMFSSRALRLKMRANGLSSTPLVYCRMARQLAHRNRGEPWGSWLHRCCGS